MKGKGLPTDLERVVNFMKMIGWTPKKFGRGLRKRIVDYSDGAFHANFEKYGSAEIHIEYKQLRED